MSFSDSVFDRQDVFARSSAHAMSKNLYAFTVCVFVFLGIGASLAASVVSHDWNVDSTASLLWLIIPTFLVALAGVFIATGSDNPAISMLGYAMVAIPFGLMLGPVLAEYTTASIVKVLVITTAIVAIFGIVGAIIPDNLEGLGSYVFGALLILILGYLFAPLAHFFGVETATALTALDWLGVVLFCGIVVFDWNRAMRLPRTLDNAVDSALAVYLDWFNIFIRLLAIMGNSSSSSRN
jgi:FtsH-binding integral membrane protein